MDELNKNWNKDLKKFVIFLFTPIITFIVKLINYLNWKFYHSHLVFVREIID
jgi:hypothetical protein